MANVINTNTAALASKNALVETQRSIDQSIARLSTGQRVNSAADDAAGLAIGNKMTSQIRSLDQAVRNANDGISMLQTADAATNQMTQMLVRMRELAIQSANDTNGQTERTALQSEFSGLQAQLNSIISTTTWNGMKLLTGEPNSAATNKTSFQVGASANDTIELPLSDFSAAGDVKSSTAGSVSIGSRIDATASIEKIDKAMKQIDGDRAQWGATMNRLTYAADNAINVSLNLSASQSRIMDTDYAQTTAEMARAMILDQAGNAMLSQANQQPMYVLALLL